MIPRLVKPAALGTDRRLRHDAGDCCAAPALGAGRDHRGRPGCRRRRRARRARRRVAPVPDRARFVAELARVIYSSAVHRPLFERSRSRRRIDAFFADARQPAAARDDETVPVPLPAALWSQAVFHRQVDRRDLVGAILTDRTAALDVLRPRRAWTTRRCEFLAEHPSLLGRLAERAPAAVRGVRREPARPRRARRAARRRRGRAAVGSGSPAKNSIGPERFVRSSSKATAGGWRTCYDVLSHLDPATLAFALDASVQDADER